MIYSNGSRFGNALLKVLEDSVPSILAGQPSAEVRLNAEVIEDKDSYVISMEIPGVEAKDVAVTCENGILYVKGEKKSVRTEQDGEVIRQERSFGTFSRSWELPKEVDQDSITASSKHGVLLVTVPKARAKAKNLKTITVQT
jgi:HSP20 family protein